MIGTVRRCAAYATSDERIFKSVEEAKRHELRLLLQERLERMVERFFTRDVTQSELVEVLVEEAPALEQLVRDARNEVKVLSENET